MLGAGSDPLGLAFDAGNLWAADGEKRQIVRLAAESGVLTRFTLPTGTAPQVAAVIDGAVWYTESGSGTVGRHDPAVAPGSSAAASSDTFAVAASCSTLPAGTVTAISANGGTPAWSGRVWAEGVGATGWTVYQLPAGSSPFGVAAVERLPWVVNRGRQVIALAGGPSSPEAPTPTRTASPIATLTPPGTATNTPTATETNTPGPSPTPSVTATVTRTATPGPSPTPSATPGPPEARLYLPLLQR